MMKKDFREYEVVEKNKGSWVIQHKKRATVYMVFYTEIKATNALINYIQKQNKQGD